MRPGALLAGAAIAALAACSPAPASPAPASGPADPAGPEAALEPAEAAPGASVSGEVTWAGLDLPETARLIVEVRDTARTADVDDLVLKQEFPSTPSPLAFSASVPAEDLKPEGNLVLRARLQDGYAILLASNGDVDIADTGETPGLSIPLYNPEDLARGGPGGMITPSGAAYVCGGEAITIAVEAGAAYVTFADGTRAKLDKLTTAEGVNTQFSNGKLVVEQAGDGLRFGRGRAAVQPCTLAG
jgi:uncharacterized lipoprotein YbaY